MKKRKLNTPLILMIFFCLAFTVVLVTFESHHNKIKEQINDNKAKISLLEAENKELTHTISELETVIKINCRSYHYGKDNTKKSKL